MSKLTYPVKASFSEKLDCIRAVQQSRIQSGYKVPVAATRTKAVAMGKELLTVEGRPRFNTRDTKGVCSCGECSAVEIWMTHNGEYSEVVVNICAACSA